MSDLSNKLIVLTNEGMGGGDPDLARKMMRGFLKMLKIQEKKPQAIFFMGNAVNLVTDNSPVFENLKSLAESGVELLVCKAAVEWYQLESKITIGRIISTGRWLELMGRLEVITL